MKTSQRLQDNDLLIPNQTWGIFLISILGLFLETLFIRWIGTEIRIFAYLQNTILVACFLGLGLGMFTSTKRVEIKQSLVPLTLLLFLMAIPASRMVLGRISEFLSTHGDFLIWGPLEAHDRTQQVIYLAAGLALTYVVLILIVDTFVPLGRILGRLLNINKNPIWAYSVNILGSIFGTWAFVLFSYLYQPPLTWFLVAAGLFACFILWSNRDRRIPVVLLGVIIVLSWFVSQVPGALNVIWSPYQKLEVWKSEPNWLGDFQIHVNNSGYQVITDLSQARVSSEPNKFSQQVAGLSQYDLPFLFHPSPKSVLLVGAGAGNDAAGALRHNVQSVTAVEIDPTIISLGKEFHPEHPYLSPRVRVVNDDARSFFATTTEKFDVISFGLLDSHTTTSMTNARLDHYVYTMESLLQAKSKLNNDGIIVLTFEVQKPFIADRIRTALEETFNQPPLVFQIPYGSYGFGGVMFVTGDLGSVQKQLDQNHALSGYIQELQKTNPIDLPHSTKVITDDWPYLYLASAKIPVLYYLLIGLMIAVFIRSNKKWQSDIGLSDLNRSFWHFFSLGAGFLLLEVQNISKASVVLGNTWQVNAVIISSILIMALLANWIAYRFSKLPLPLVYSLLVGTCLVLYFIDLARFGFLVYPLKATIVGALTSLPMLFSGMVFIRSFALARDKSNALGANLIEALVGALLQSITFITGIKTLLIVVAGFYLLALFTKSSPSKTDEQAIQVELLKQT
jgi:spermidine synthase